VQHFDGCTEIGDTVGKLSGSEDHPGRLHAEDGPEAFAAGKNAVPHGAVNGVGQSIGRGQQVFQRGIRERDSGGQQRAYRRLHLRLMINQELLCRCRVARRAMLEGVQI